MSYCSNCGAKLPDGAAFCGNCGTPVANGHIPPPYPDDGIKKHKPHIKTDEHKTTTSVEKETVIGRINRYVGNDSKAELNWRVLFSDVLKPHTVDEALEIFISGTSRTTPDPANVSANWPHPWFYSRVLLILLAGYLILWFLVASFNSVLCVPGMAVVGSFAMPVAVMILFFEANVWHNVSMYRVMQIFLLGGLASLVLTLMLFGIFPDSVSGSLDYFNAFIVVIVEELGKMLIVFFFLRNMKQRSILSALLIGASIGAGFAAFESAGYAFIPIWQLFGYQTANPQFQVTPQAMADVISSSVMLRGFLAPGGHVAWAAVSGAALVLASKEMNVFDFSLLTNKRFLRLFVIPVVLHGLWDCPLSGAMNSIFPYLAYILLIFAIWTILLILVNMGLAEVGKSTKTDNNN